MVENLLFLPIGEEAPSVVNAVVEIPKDSTNKYEYDKELLVFRLDRALHSSVHYPGDYGFIPSTLAKDGDPLDVLIISDSPTFTGCLLPVRPVGVLNMKDQGVLDEKILAVAASNPQLSGISNYDQLYPHLLREVNHFFAIYKELEGKSTQMMGWQDVAAAHVLIRESDEAFQSKRGEKS